MRHVLLVLLAAATTVAGCGGTEPERSAEPAPTGAASPSAPAPTSPITSEATPTASPEGWPCSARELSPEPVSQPELPDPVRDMRRRVVQAAVACDLEQLATLATSGPAGFTYSFGGDGDPAGYWRQEEEAGREPLRLLVEVLNLPGERLEHQEDVQHVWPSAFAHTDWESVPAEDRRALEALYSEDELEAFARFGSYAGHRVGMTPEGEWLFFVAGD